jgi:hypothetical protein
LDSTILMTPEEAAGPRPLQATRAAEASGRAAAADPLSARRNRGSWDLLRAGAVQRVKCACWVALGLCAAPFAAADDAPRPSNADDLGRCAAMAAPDARLACYDGLASRHLPAPAAVAAPSAEFGLHPAQRRPPEPEAITANVTQTRATARGATQVSLDNGQVWEFDGADALIEVHSQIVIRRAAFGSYLMTTSSQRTRRVHRLQ